MTELAKNLKAEILEVTGPRIKIEVEAPTEQKTAGGIIVSTDIKAKEDQETGIVVQLGHCAYGNFSTPWCKVGDKVLFQRYAGKPQEELGEDGKSHYYRVLKDIDIIGVFKEKEVIVK